ncbi:hypothetical protein DKU74_20045 [Salmonella enterica subsp. salamae]|nr:hypothetical protein [Salmonella enterica subsp. salamae]ECC8832775.1 hypothetical protein [Salmonella enterica subsp. salamae]EDU3771442.1 hypothetical protein [Salmonella enterica subsp. enterica serovar Minnesota]EGX0284753.1 hypothetical protein [Salmonella enterica]
MKWLIVLLFSVFTVAANAATTAEKLTILSLDKEVRSDSPEVRRTQAAFDRNATVCTFDNEDKLANAVWYVTKKIRSEGYYAESTDIIEGLNAILLGAKEKVDCTEILSEYAVTRMDGKTHSDAIVGARGLYRAMGIVQ